MIPMARERAADLGSLRSARSNARAPARCKTAVLGGRAKRDRRKSRPSSASPGSFGPDAFGSAAADSTFLGSATQQETSLTNHVPWSLLLKVLICVYTVWLDCHIFGGENVILTSDIQPADARASSHARTGSRSTTACNASSTCWAWGVRRMSASASTPSLRSSMSR